jgi:NAD(P)-dependent dehydrogenase (short-subunit alcohol dehydrogenase family)
MARDLKEDGVTCNAFCPGARTRLSTGEEYEEKIRILYQRGCLTEDRKNAALSPPDPAFVTPLVLYLSSDHASHINGQLFSVSGGYLGLFPEPEEVFLAYKDVLKQGGWTFEELAKILRRDADRA